MENLYDVGTCGVEADSPELSELLARLERLAEVMCDAGGRGFKGEKKKGGKKKGKKGKKKKELKKSNKKLRSKNKQLKKFLRTKRGDQFFDLAGKLGPNAIDFASELVKNKRK